MRQNQRRTVAVRDDVRHREGLAGTGNAEQGLLLVAAEYAVGQLLYRLRLVAGRGVVRV